MFRDETRRDGDSGDSERLGKTGADSERREQGGRLVKEGATEEGQEGEGGERREEEEEGKAAASPWAARSRGRPAAPARASADARRPARAREPADASLRIICILYV